MRCLMLAIMSLVIVICFTTGVAKAGSKTNKTTLKQNKISEKYDTNICCLTCDTLSPGYIGHDLIKLFNALDNFTSIAKSEYETTEQFNDRLVHEQSKPILGKLTIDDVYCIMVKPEVEYDADNNFIKLIVKEESDIFTGPMENPHIDYDHKGIIIKETKDIKGKYRGMNAFGATATISTGTYTSTGIALTKNFNQYEGKKYTFSRAPDAIVLNLEGIVPNVAKECRNDIRILFTVKLKKPYLVKHMSYSAPTISSPYANTYINQYVYATLKELSIYNYKTGFVFKKIRIEE